MPSSRFSLNENPFVERHDARFLFPGRAHLDVVARLRRGIESGAPFALVTGLPGVGKTTAVQTALAGFESRVVVQIEASPSLTQAQLRERVLSGFAAGGPGPAHPARPADGIEARLRAVRASCRTAFLVVDEAQNLRHPLLEDLRVLSNLEADGSHLLQIILVGQPKLEEDLSRPGREALLQRIAVRCRLGTLSAEETEAYIRHRVSVAGGDPEGLFTGESCQAVHHLTHGVPREINLLAGEALMLADTAGENTITAGNIATAAVLLGFRSVVKDSEPAAAAERPVEVTTAEMAAVADADTEPDGREELAVRLAAALEASLPAPVEPPGVEPADESLEDEFEIPGTTPFGMPPAMARPLAPVAEAPSMLPPPPAPPTATATPAGDPAATPAQPARPAARAKAVGGPPPLPSQPTRPAVSEKPVGGPPPLPSQPTRPAVPEKPVGGPPPLPARPATGAAPSSIPPAAPRAEIPAAAVTPAPVAQPEAEALQPTDLAPAAKPASAARPEVDAWVARFRDPAGPPKIGSRLAPAPAAPRVVEPRSPVAAQVQPTAAPPADRAEPHEADVPTWRSPRQESRWSTAAWAAGALVLVATVGIVLVHSSRGPARSRPATRATVAASPGRSVSAHRASPSPERPTLAPVPHGTASARPPASAPVPAPAASAHRREQAAPAPAPTPAATQPAPAPPPRLYGVEVATFISRSRASEERDRLATLVPLPCHVVDVGDDGFAVVVGPASSSREATRWSTELSERKLVSEARVVRWAVSDTTRR